MKSMLFLISLISMPSALFSMAEKSDQDLYESWVIKTFKPTTKTFMERNPEAKESQILQRYVQEVAKNTIKMGYEDQYKAPELIFKQALQGTPGEYSRLYWILTGEKKKSPICPTDMASDRWREKQEDIEERIASGEIDPYTP